MPTFDLATAPFTLSTIVTLAFVLLVFVVNTHPKLKKYTRFITPGIVGISFVGVGIFIGSEEYRVYTTFEQTTGIVTGMQEHKARRRKEISIQYDPIVTIQRPTGEQRFVDSFASVFHTYAIGQSVPVLVDPAQSKQSRIKNPINSMLLPIAFSSIGLFVLLFGTVFPWRQLKKREREIQQLRSGGRVIPCTIVDVQEEQISTRKRRRGFVYNLSVSSNQLPQQTFLSDQLFQAPSKAQVVGQLVTTYVDPNDPSRYWVDTDSLGLS